METNIYVIFIFDAVYIRSPQNVGSHGKSVIPTKLPYIATFQWFRYHYYRYSTGDLYEGYFKDAMRHGHGVFRKGKYLNSASFVYVGEWLFDKKHGYGVMDDILKGMELS